MFFFYWNMIFYGMDVISLQFTEGRTRSLMKWDEANSGAYGQMFSGEVGWKLRSTRGIKEFGENEKLNENTMAVFASGTWMRACFKMGCL